MAFAIEQHTALSNQLRFLLFEIGIGFTPRAMDGFLMTAYSMVMETLTYSALVEEKQPFPPFFSLNLSEAVAEFRSRFRQPHHAKRFLQWETLERHLRRQWIQISLQLAWNAHAKHWDNPCVQKPTLFHQPSLRALSQWAAMNCYTELPSKDAINRTERELLQYGASFKARVHLHWLALERKQAQCIPGLFELSQTMKKLFADEHQQWQEKLAHMKLNATHYLPLPMHPWYWRQIRHRCEVLQEAIPIPIAQDWHVLNTLEHLCPENNQRPWLRFFATTSPQHFLNRTDCETYNQRLQRWNGQHTLQWLPLLTTIALPIARGQTLMVHPQINPHAMTTEHSNLWPVQALLSHNSDSDQPLLDYFLCQSQRKPLDFFHHFLSAILVPSLHLLITDGIAMTLDPQSCLIEWNTNGNQWTVHAIHSEIRRCMPIGQEKTTTQQQQACAHWQYHLLQTTIRLLISQMASVYGFEAPQLWKKVKSMIANVLDQYPKTQCADYTHQILQASWPIHSTLNAILDPHQEEYQLNRIPNLLLSVAGRTIE